MVSVFDLKYGEIYSLKGVVVSKDKRFIYIGSTLKGKGRLLSREDKAPVIYNFDLGSTNLVGKVLNVSNSDFSPLSLDEKIYFHALETLTKKGL